MTVTATELRQSIYTILDEVLATGTPVEIVRHGRKLRIVPADPPARLARLVKRDCIVGNPDDLKSIDWSTAWKPGI